MATVKTLKFGTWKCSFQGFYHTLSCGKTSRIRPTTLERVLVFLGVFPAPINVHTHQDGHSQPDHKHEEEESVADVTSEIGDQADQERAYERT